MIFDPRKKQNAKDNVIINCSTVETVHSYKYLGVTIQDNLKWDQHVNIQVKKANKRMYHVRCLRKLKVDNKLLCLFYNSVISSVLVYAISSWFNACNVKLQNNVTKFSRKLYKMSDSNCHHLIENPSTVCNIRCLNLISKILNDSNHPLNEFVVILPHGRIDMPFCKTARFKTTFLPYAIKLTNSNVHV